MQRNWLKNSWKGGWSRMDRWLEGYLAGTLVVKETADYLHNRVYHRPGGKETCPCTKEFKHASPCEDDGCPCFARGYEARGENPRYG